MFETATWRTHNRRHFDVVDGIYRTAGVPFGPDASRDADDAKFAATVVHQIGSHLLMASIGTATSANGKRAGRLNAKAWKAVGADDGVHASIFFTLASAGILTPEIATDEDGGALVSPLRALVLETFDVPAEYLERIEEVRAQVIEVLNDDLTKFAEENGGLRRQMTIERGETTLSWLGMQLAGIDVDRLPAFAPVRGVPPERWAEVQGLEWLISFSIEFGSRWSHLNSRFIELGAIRSTGAEDFRMVERALELQASPDWQWAEVPAVAIAKSAQKLTDKRDEYEMVLAAISLGYWIRQAELELDQGFNSFDDAYIENMRRSFTGSKEPDLVIKIGMVEVAEGLPGPFAPGADLWEAIQGLAREIWDRQAAEVFGHEEDLDLNPEGAEKVRRFAIGLGYGLGVTTEALEIDAVQPREMAG